MGTVLIVLAVLIALAVVAVVVAGAVIWRQMDRHQQRVRDELRDYVEERGGTIRYDEDGKGGFVEGPLGSETISLGLYFSILEGKPRERWDDHFDSLVGRAVPGLRHRAMTSALRQDLEHYGPKVAALDADAIRERLRVRVIPRRRPDEGLATCARPLSEDSELRVVLEGMHVGGLIQEGRDRLEETDDELFERALEQTLDTPPADGRADHPAWLYRPRELFGDQPAVAVGDGDGLAWIPARPDQRSALVALARRSAQPGPLRGTLWAWDGEDLAQRTIVQHSIKGPDTPDYTVDLPPAVRRAFGVEEPGRIALVA